MVGLDIGISRHQHRCNRHGGRTGLWLARIGQLRWQAIRRVDIPTIIGISLVAAVAILTGDLLADLVAPSLIRASSCRHSALLAILLGEPERARFKRFLLAHEVKISAGTLIETLWLVQLAFGPEALSGVDALMETSAAEIVPIDADQVVAAREGMLRFGKGRGEEPAALNFGDLFAYALARRLDLPLLFKGDAFARTDVRPARP